jgi:hypothetical protein
MQKIDTSAMMRDLTEHETTQVSGGLGESYSFSLPDSAVPNGYTVDDISDVQFILDSTTNELTTILSFTPAADAYGYQANGFQINHEGNGASTTRTETVTTTSPSITLNASGTFKITIFGRGVDVTLGGIVTTGGTTRTRTTTTTTTGTSRSGGSFGGGGNRDGGTIPKATKKH